MIGAHFFRKEDGGVSIRVPLIVWCVYDALVVAFLINLHDLKRTYSGHGVRLAFWIYLGYSIAFGFPMGTATKVICRQNKRKAFQKLTQTPRAASI